MCVNEKEAISMLERIRDEENDWTREAFDSFGMAMDALENQLKAKRLRKALLNLASVAALFSGLISLACVEGGDSRGIIIGLMLLVIGVVTGNACHND